ncbi:MAG: class I SAM-dependent methyltransferase [Desulfobacterales bacterium]|nr:class I SAM-dependent methyltransferase [Desulfobacterales bacterium]
MELDKEHVEIEMVERLADIRGKRVLEIGCGDGRVTARLARTAGAYTAIDPDAASIAKARATIRGVDFRVGSGERLEFEHDSFDVILFTLSLHHQDSAAALDQAHGALRPGGRLVIVEPAVDGEVEGFYNIFEDETEALENALEAIASGDFVLERREVFTTDWLFDDKEELYDYLFKENDTGPEDGIIEKINGRLGPKLNSRPIHLKETLHIFALGKEGR